MFSLRRVRPAVPWRAGVAFALAAASFAHPAATTHAQPAAGSQHRVLPPSQAQPQLPPAPDARPKVLRYAFRVAETGFDPAQISDLYSRIITANMFDAPLTYDYLARPAKLKVQTAAALPDVSADYRTFTFRIRHGIYFADDPAFKGVKRELTAADYIYSLKRLYDPALKSPSLFQLENAKILGMSELRKQAIDRKQPFPYDTPVAGLVLNDRYSFTIKLAEPSPRFAYYLADGAVTGAVAREIIEAYPGKAMEHPVGTGPYRLASWTRSSKIVLERNPNYREHYYDEEAEAGNAKSLAFAARYKGRRLPMIDRVEVSIIEEQQPRWLGFLNHEHDFIERLPEEFAPTVVPHGQLAPNMRKLGLDIDRNPYVDITFSFFNMQHPVVGGYTPDKVALRRAIALAYDSNQEIEIVRRGQAVPAQGIVAPLLTGYDPAFKSEMSDHDLPRAKALLDLYGYVDRDGDGWRDQPDGQPLKIIYHSQPDQASRQLTELWHKAFNALQIRVEFAMAKWPENLKASRAGKLMMWGVSWGGVSPDPSYFLSLMYGQNIGQSNHARFDLPAYNRLYERQLAMPDGPERLAVIREMQRYAIAYMPYKVSCHRIWTDLSHPWFAGYRRHPFMRDFWRYVDIDTQRLPEELQ